MPRTIRLDPSDTFVFDRAAEPGEWAVSGAFVFWNRDLDTLGQKQRVALRSGFLGIDSFGWSTLAIVTEATEVERHAMVERLAAHLLAKFGAPDHGSRAAAAEEEVVFASSLCDHSPQTMLAVQRSVEDGEIRERFRTLRPRETEPGADRLHAHARAFTFHEVEGDDEPAEEVDLLGLDQDRQRDQGSPMREFWVASGHHLTRRADHGGLIATPELIMAYLARPELMPPDDACEAERNLHANLLADPLRPVSKADIAALADADARENWTFMMNFRDRLVAAPSLEAVYVSLARNGASDLPPIFLSQFCHLILRNALEGCDDPYVLRAAELFYRSQLATVHDGTLLLADAEVVEAQQHAQADIHSSPLTAMLSPPKAFGEMDVMDDDNAWTYWSRSDAHAMVMNIGGNPKARDGLTRVIERWIAHLLGVAVKVETVASIEDRDWRWFVGLDSEGTRIGNALWNGAAPEARCGRADRRADAADHRGYRLVDERVGNRPVYLILARDADKVVRLKPQNLVAGLPLASTADVA